jgi:hypothetical protein
MRHTNASKTARFPSLIETISQGFGAVNNCLWVLAIPVLLDLYYWFGPRISPQPLLDRVVAVSKAVNPQAWDTQQQQAVTQLGATPYRVDFSPFGGVLSGWGTPKFINILTPLISPPPPPLLPDTWHIGSFAALVGTVALVGIVGLLAAALYLLVLSDAVRGDGLQRPNWRRMASIFGSLLGILLLAAGVVVFIGIPLLAMAYFVRLVNPVAGDLIVTVIMALMLWLWFTASFSFDAVAISDVGPVRALLTSLFIVQRSFWSAAALFGLGWLILAGTSVIWQIVSGSVAGLVIAMVGSAYISSGLAAAHLVFYRDRLSWIARRT